MVQTYYQIEFIDGGTTYLDDRTFGTPEEAAKIGWYYVDNEESISAAWIRKTLAGVSLERLNIDDYPR